MYEEIKSMFDLRQFAIQQVGFALAKGKQEFTIEELIDYTEKVVSYLKGDIILPEYSKPVNPLETMLKRMESTPSLPINTDNVSNYN